MSTEYKKGDRVRRINQHNGSFGARIGQEGVVESSDSRMVFVSYSPRNLHANDRDHPEGWYRENVELIPPIFKIGDKVGIRTDPEKVYGVVVAVLPEAAPASRLVILTSHGIITTRHSDGRYYLGVRESGIDAVPYVPAPKIEKVVRYVRPFAYLNSRDMLTFRTRKAADEWVPILPPDAKYYLGKVQEVVMEVEVPSGE